MRKTNAVRTIGGLFVASLLTGFGTAAWAEARYDVVLARDTDHWQVCRAAGESTTLQVQGDGDTDLDLFVYDENGFLIDSDTRATDYGRVDWRPRWTGCFDVRVVNLGPRSNLYVLVID